MSAFLQEGSGGVRFGFTYNGDGAMPRRVAPSVERFGETSLDRSFPIFSAVRDCPRRPRNDGT